MAAKHYLQTTDDHFAKATKKAQHNAQQSASESEGNGRNAKEVQRENLEDLATSRELESCGVGDTGFEPVTSAV